jgi:nondiscriminating glutamyl-tRNA synthetase
MRKNILLPHEATIWGNIFFGDTNIDEKHIDILVNAGERFFEYAFDGVLRYDHDIKSIIEYIKTNLGISGKNLFMPIRIALTGLEHGPELVQIAELLGKKRMLQRFELAKNAVLEHKREKPL